MKKILSTIPDSIRSASLVDSDGDRHAAIRGIEAGPGIILEVVDADDGRFSVADKKVRISTNPAGVFRYMGVLNALTDNLPTNPIKGDTYRIIQHGDFSSTYHFVNVGDVLAWNGTTWDTFDNTDSTVTGTPGRIFVAGTADHGFVVNIDTNYLGQSSITTVGTITSGSWNGEAIALKFGGANTDLTTLSDGSMLVKMGNRMAVIEPPVSPDYVLTHDGGLVFSWKKRGEVNVASNIGATQANTAGVFSYKNGSELFFKRLVGGANMTITEDQNSIILTSRDTGEVNTASNLGTKGLNMADVYKVKNVYDFAFRRLSGSNTITITESDNTVSFTTNLHSVATSGNYMELGNRPAFAPVAMSGSYNDLINKPALATVALSGNYQDLTNIPVLAPIAMSGSYTDLTGKPVLATVAMSGSYADLTGRPTLATVATSGKWIDILQRPTFATVATTGSYNDLINKPVLAVVATSGSYTDLSNKPTYATVATSGSYTDLVNKPNFGTAAYAASTIFATSSQGTKADTAVQPGQLSLVATSGSYVDLTNKPSFASVALSGSYSDLSNKPTLFSGSWNDLTNKPFIPVTLANMNDAAITSPISGQVIRFNTTSGKWENVKLGYGDLTGTPTLGTAASMASSAFATALQGSKADSAIQPGALSLVATSGAYNDLSGKPVLFSGQYGDLVNRPVMAAIADIPSPATATAEECANKINELLAALRSSGLLT